MLRILTLGIAFAATAAHAQQIAPFPADECSPGLTAAGDFVDLEGRIIDQLGWVATAKGVIVDANNNRVLFDSAATAACIAGKALTGTAATNVTLVSIAPLAAAAVLVGLAGGANSTTTITPPN